MIKILTAIGNPVLNEKLQKLENVFVIGKDIQYQDGILEILEENIDIDCLIINRNLPGEIYFFELIKKIKKIKENIEIYIFLENKDEDTEKQLNSQNIYKIYYLCETDFDCFTQNFKENKNDVLYEINKEINDFKKIILNENKDNYSLLEEKINEGFEKNELEDFENEYKSDYNNSFYNNEDKEECDCQTIAISGNFGAGKSVISTLLSKIISNKNKKTLLIDFDFENSSINTLFGIRKYKENQNYIDDFIFDVDENLDIMCGIDKIINIKEKMNNYVIKEIVEQLKKDYEFIVIDVSSRIDFKYVKIILTFCNKIIFLIEPNLLEISKSNKILEVFLNDWDIEIDKIKIVFNKSNKYKIAESILEEIFSEFEIIGDIDYEEKYNLFINKNTNIDFEKVKFEEIYEKLNIKKEEIYANSSVRNC